MKQAMLLCALLLANATEAFAAGLNLRWSACAADAGVQNHTFACDTNIGSNTMVGSFVLDHDMLCVGASESVVDLSAAGASLPDWWRYSSAGTCRQAALSIAARNGTDCPDMFEAQGSMNIAAYQVGLHGENSARILSVNGLQITVCLSLVASQEYGIAHWTIQNSKTVGSGSCTGCVTPTCIVFNSANIYGCCSSVTTLTTEASAGSNYITWQGGGGTSCPTATHTKQSSWGSVKSLYR